MTAGTPVLPEPSASPGGSVSGLLPSPSPSPHAPRPPRTPSPSGPLSLSDPTLQGTVPSLDFCPWCDDGSSSLLQPTRATGVSPLLRRFGEVLKDPAWGKEKHNTPCQMGLLLGAPARLVFLRRVCGWKLQRPLSVTEGTSGSVCKVGKALRGSVVTKLQGDTVRRLLCSNGIKTNIKVLKKHLKRLYRSSTLCLHFWESFLRE